MAFPIWTGQLPNATADVNGGVGVYGTNNRVSAWAYDGAGNLTGIPAAGGSTVRAACASGVMPGVAMMRTACYDAENRMISETDANGNTATYAYDGDGHRVSKDVNNVTTTLVYDPQGQLAQEYGGAPIPAAELGTRYVTADQLGSTRLLTKADGTVAQTYDYLPFGEEFVQSGDTNRVRFTGKERDAETGLDYFGLRYFSSAQGRWTSPDQPFADQHPEDPQSWNMYGYVRNNPLKNTDPDGKACFSLNNNSPFCGRATEYGQWDARVSGQTRFFAAASAVSQVLADTDVSLLRMNVSGLAISGSTQSFLSTLGKDLEKMNTGIVASIEAGSMQGEGLDARLVHTEQMKVQESLDALKKSDPTAYNQVIKDSNAMLNPTGAMQFAGSRFKTDAAYQKVLDEVRKSLPGGKIDFSSQSDREAIGNALIKHIRQPGGCDVSDDKVKVCN